MDAHTENPLSYRVEVSGWDEKENFFVERTQLDWNEDSGKRIALRASVAADAVVFVRLAQQMGGGSSFPIPYRAIEVMAERDGSRRLITVQQLQPRMAFQEMPESLFPTRQELA